MRSGAVNQDAIGWAPQGSVGYPTMMAVADGHGSAKCFRSARGAELAVQTAIRVLRKFGGSFTDYQPGMASIVKRVAEEQLPESLVKEWLQLVDEDHAANPFSDSELNAVGDREGPASVEAVRASPTLAYGATLVAVYADRGYVLYVQLGDGDIVAVSDAGEASRPVPTDERLFANETTSLCSPEAWRDVRVAFQPASEALPALILLSTDGYANSFRSEEDFLKVGPDILGLLTKDGLSYVRDSMESWLSKASEAGSGDDVTLGALCRVANYGYQTTNNAL